MKGKELSLSSISMTNKSDKKDFVVLGFDPGSQVTGWGVIRNGSSPSMEGVGVIKPPSGESIEIRLEKIYSEAKKLIKKYKPDIVVVENPFVGKSASSALVLGQARGVILLAATRSGLEVASYAPRAIKSSVAGNGNASKEQVQFMVQKLLYLKEAPTPLDASDALAVAMCHIHRSKRTATVDSKGPNISRLASNPKDIEAIMKWKKGKN